jgi:hypothetical protein
MTTKNISRTDSYACSSTFGHLIISKFSTAAPSGFTHKIINMDKLPMYQQKLNNN